MSAASPLMTSRTFSSGLDSGTESTAARHARSSCCAAASALVSPTTTGASSESASAMPGERKARVHPIRHTRALHQRGSSLYPYVARLCDGRPGDGSDETWERWRWQVQARSAQNTAYRADLPEHPAVVLIDAASYRMAGGSVLQAAELALFRHLVVSGLLALCPSAQPVGGLSSWSDNWWAEASAG